MFKIPRHLFTKLKKTEEFKHLVIYDATIIIDTYTGAALLGFSHRNENQRDRAIDLITRTGLKYDPNGTVFRPEKTGVTLALIQFIGTEELASALQLKDIKVKPADIELTPENQKILRDAAQKFLSHKVKEVEERKSYQQHLAGMSKYYIIDSGDAGVVPAFVDNLAGELMLALTPVPHIWACFTFKTEAQVVAITSTLVTSGITAGGVYESKDPTYPSVAVGLLGFCSEPSNTSEKTLESLGRTAAEEFYKLNCEFIDDAGSYLDEDEDL